ncbi:MAG: hypothetical protein NZ585_11210 [Chloracidobacterium sp.]|nr:hypothetical protein [Chloracidobacterium sp.]MDW8218179.1 hypothetical protein [Acidobacteriota bacterium]
MLITLAVWILLATLASVIGSACLAGSAGTNPTERFVVAVWAGVGVLANLWLVAALGTALTPWVAAVVAAVAVGAALRLSQLRLVWLENVRLRSPAALFSFTAVTVAAAVAVAPVTLIDTGIYHYPAMRWLAEYGVVKGTALLDVQLGYASTWFALFAPFTHGGMKTRTAALGGGFALALWLTSAVLSGLRIVRGVGRTSDWFLVWATALGVGALSQVEGLLPSSSPDVPTAALIVTTAWVILSGEQSPDGVRAGGQWATVLAGVAVGIKLTAAPLLLVAGWLDWRAAGYGRRAALGLAAIGGAALLPVTLARVVASGCPLFPSKLFALSVPWRYEMNPWQVADGTPRELTVAIRDQARWDWGALASPRYSDGPLNGLLDWRWLPDWPSHEPVAAALLAGGLSATLVMLTPPMRCLRVPGWGWMLALGWLGGAYVLTQAPSLRFGVGYFVIPPALGLAQVSAGLPRWSPILPALGLAVLLPWPSAVPLVCPPRLTPTPVALENVNGMALYRPIPQPGVFPRCGDSPLPCGSNIDPTVRLRDPRRGVVAGFVRGCPPQ